VNTTPLIERPFSFHPPEQQPTPRGNNPSAPGQRFLRIAEMGGLLILPILFYLICRPVFLLNHIGGLDSTFYSTTYSNLRDLVHRFGPAYYLVRFGLIFPGALFRSLLEPYAGALAFRYCMLLAGGIPVFCMAKRLAGSRFAWLAYLFVSTNPLFLRTLSDDNPELVAVPWTLAGFSLILWNPRPRWFLYMVLGGLFGLVFNANFFLISTWGLMLVPYLYLEKEHRTFPALLGRLGKDLTCFLIGFSLIELAGILVYYRMFGIWKIWEPTIAMVLSLARGGQRAWKVQGWDWLKTQYVVFLPVVLLVLHVLLRRLRPASRQANTAAIWLAFIYGFHVFYEFICGGNVLLFHLYAYFMVPSMLLLGVFILKEIHALLGGGWWSVAGLSNVLLAASLLLKFPAWASWGGGKPILWVYGLALGAVLIVATVRAVPVMRPLLLIVPVAMTVFALESTYRSIYQVDSLAVLSGPPFYRQLVKFTQWMPKKKYDSRNLTFWYSPDSTNSVLDTWQSSYLWSYSRVSNRGQGAALPPFHLTKDEEAKIHHAQLLGLLAERPEDLVTMKTILTEQGFSYRVEKARSFSCGQYEIWVELLGISPPSLKPAVAAQGGAR
jgi:hypothetical protein